MSALWEKHRSTFSALSDVQIAQAVSESRPEKSWENDWLEAVVSWEASGKPRDIGVRNGESDNRSKAFAMPKGYRKRLLCGAIMFLWRMSALVGLALVVGASLSWSVSTGLDVFGSIGFLGALSVTALFCYGYLFLMLRLEKSVKEAFHDCGQRKITLTHIPAADGENRGV